MKLINTVLLLVILSGCGQNAIQLPQRSKIGIHSFTSGDPENQAVNWYYIRNINASGDKGYYFESEKPVENFTNVHFVYYNSRPDKLNEIYPLKEKLILVNAKDLPVNIQQSLADLESISVRE